MNRLLSAERQLADLAARRRGNSRLTVVAEHLLRRPLADAPTLARTISRTTGSRISAVAVRDYLGELTDHGLLREVTGRASFRLFTLA